MIDEIATVKLIAMYYPQLHATPENDEWWGEGFTDWVNVKDAKPQFEGHYQPRVPLGNNYYDQSLKDTLHWQIDLAKQYGLYGFCHYHYWFDGKQMLETPTNIMLENKDLNLPFCLSWANETWSRRWDGLDHHILIKQTHPPEKDRWLAHYNYLINAWGDERAIKVDGKPVFIIYRPHRIHHINNMLDYWRELAYRDGFKGIYFIAQKQYEFPTKDCLRGFDAVFQFQPFEAIYSPDFDSTSIKHSPWFRIIRALPESIQDMLRSFKARFFSEMTFYDYDTVWEHVIKERPESGMVTFPGAFVDWDNSSRYKERATIFNEASPEKFEHWFSQLIESMHKRSLPENFIFLNAWNEWAESTYLEPDERHGYAHLDAIKKHLG